MLPVPPLGPHRPTVSWGEHVGGVTGLCSLRSSLPCPSLQLLKQGFPRFATQPDPVQPSGPHPPLEPPKFHLQGMSGKSQFTSGQKEALDLQDTKLCLSWWEKKEEIILFYSIFFSWDFSHFNESTGKQIWLSCKTVGLTHTWMWESPGALVKPTDLRPTPGQGTRASRQGRRAQVCQASPGDWCTVRVKHSQPQVRGDSWGHPRRAWFPIPLGLHAVASWDFVLWVQGLGGQSSAVSESPGETSISRTFPKPGNQTNNRWKFKTKLPNQPASTYGMFPAYQHYLCYDACRPSPPSPAHSQAPSWQAWMTSAHFKGEQAKLFWMNNILYIS